MKIVKPSDRKPVVVRTGIDDRIYFPSILHHTQHWVFEWDEESDQIIFEVGRSYITIFRTYFLYEKIPVIITGVEWYWCIKIPKNIVKLKYASSFYLKPMISEKEMEGYA